MTARSIEHQTKVPEIRKGDTVMVLTGKDAGKRGTVEHVIRRDPASSPVRSGYRRVSLKGGVYVVVEEEATTEAIHAAAHPGRSHATEAPAADAEEAEA